MSENNGVIRVGRKGLKKFAFGEDGPVFEVDVVVIFQDWIACDSEFRDLNCGEDRIISQRKMSDYNQMALDFVESLDESYRDKLSKAEALDFIARLCEEYNKLADFFQPKKRGEDESPDTSEVELRFSEEKALDNSLHSTN